MRPMNTEDLYRMKWARDPQISPDGTKVLFEIKSTVNERDLKSYKTQIYITHTETRKEPRSFTSGSGNDTSPRWSPCGTKVAFLSDREKEKNQIHILSLEGGEAARATSVPNGVRDLVWSPDGKRIAFVALKSHESQEGEKGEDQPQSDVRVIDRIRFRINGRGFLPESSAQIFVLNVESGEVVQVTQGPYDSSDPAWSPDSRCIAFVSSRFPDYEFTSVRDLWVVPLATGEMKKLTCGDGVLSLPSWAPDGKTIACYGHDNGYKGATVPGLCVLDSSGGDVRFLTKASQLGVGQTLSSDMVSHTPSRPAWSSDGKRIYFTALDRGVTNLYSINADGMELSPITRGNHGIYGWSKAPSHDVFALALTSPEIISDIWYLRPGAEDVGPVDFPLEASDGKGRAQRLTDLNREILSSCYLSLPEEVEVRGYDGQKLQAWIMKPIGIQDGKKYPLILEIHGGPHVAYGLAFFHEFQVLASRGYGVVMGNPRGSTGYGQEFVAATRHDWGGKDYADLMAITDYAARLEWVDESRMGITGGSYGGYMTNWVIGQTNRFRAAVSQRSTCNRFSQFGTSDMAYMNGDFEFDGDPWDNPSSYLDRSPIMHVRNVETPLLLIHSEEDLRCPISQADEMFVALKKLRKPVIMVRFPGENHDLSRSGNPKHRVERLEYIVAWFDRHLGLKKDYSVPLAEPARVGLKLPAPGGGAVGKDGRGFEETPR